LLASVCPEPVVANGRRFYDQLATRMDLFPVALAPRMDLIWLQFVPTCRGKMVFFFARTAAENAASEKRLVLSALAQPVRDRHRGSADQHEHKLRARRSKLLKQLLLHTCEFKYRHEPSRPCKFLISYSVLLSLRLANNIACPELF